MSPSDSTERPAVVLLGLLVLVCLACAFLMVPVLTWVPARPTLCVPLLLAIVGCVLAQGCLLAAWLAWSDQPFWRRLTRHWIVAAILYLVWVSGLAVSRPSQFASAISLGEFASAISFVGLSVPLVSFAAQMPLWIARQAFGWRLVRGDPKSDAGLARFSIRDIMKATLLIALPLALARLAPSPDGEELGMIWIFMFVMASAVSTIALLPASALLLRTEPFQRGILLASLYTACWLGLQWLVILVVRHQGLFSLPPQAMLVGISCLIVSFATTVMLTAAAARARGYRLVCARLPPSARVS
jgi:hypothetical protein